MRKQKKLLDESKLSRLFKKQNKLLQKLKLLENVNNEISNLFS